MEKLEKNLRKNDILIFGLQGKEELTTFVTNSLNILLKIYLKESDINDVISKGRKIENRQT